MSESESETTSGQNGGDYQCDSCHLDNKECAALGYCQACEEKLCGDCVVKHRRRKATSCHKLVSVQEVICKPGININKFSKVKLKYLPLCYNLFHLEQSVSGEYSSVETSRPDTLNAKIKLCDICKENNDTFRASSFCIQCDENLCDNCTNKHLIRKATQTHTLACVAVLEYEKENVYGNRAVNVCTVCHESLCEHCTETHKQKKNHTRKSIRPAPDTYRTCDQCEMAREMYGPQYTTAEEQEATKLLKQPFKKDCPGKPWATNVLADSIALTWERPSRFVDGNFYQIMYKDIERDKKWKDVTGKFYIEYAVLNGLRSNTGFKFRVRAMYEDIDDTSSVESDKIATQKSPALRFAESSNTVKDGNPSPSVYALPLKVSEKLVEKFAMYGVKLDKAYEIGERSRLYCKWKTILLVGAPGSGKSTLVDALINYVLGVSWDDPYRFTVIQSRDDFPRKAGSDGADTAYYTLNPEIGGRLPYQLHVIDTVAEELDIFYLISNNESIIDVVCFVVRATEVRRKADQITELMHFNHLFNEYKRNNICTFVTFADSNTPPVLSALKESGLHFGEIFTFNNSSLFVENENISNMTLSRVFWDMCFKSFTTFFKHIENMKAGHVETLRGEEILNEQQVLEAIMKENQLQIVKFMSTASALTQKGYDIKDNPSLKSTFRCKAVTETVKAITELPAGKRAYHCIRCNVTCFEYNNRYVPRQLYDLEACKCCPRKCASKNHFCTDCKFETVNVTRYEEISEQDNVTEGIYYKIDDFMIEKMVNDLYNIVCSVITFDKKLKAIASECDFYFQNITVGEYIDDMIADERQERKEGFLIRLNILKDLLRRHDLQTQERELRIQYESDLRRRESELSRALQRRESELRKEHERALQAKEKELKGRSFFSKLFG